MEDGTEQVSWKSVLELNDTTKQMTGWTGSWHPGKSQLPGSCSESLLSRTYSRR